MTEAAWLASGDAQEMFNYLYATRKVQRRKAGKRKLRLFGCAACRTQWDQMTDPRSRAAVEFVERLADEAVGPEGLDAVREAANDVVSQLLLVPAEERGGWYSPRHRAATAATIVADRRVSNAAFAHWALNCAMSEHVPLHREWRDRLRELGHVLRDIFGNPFRTVAVEPAWLTSTVVTLAEGIYADRAFDRLPILADALMDAGCDHDDVLDHCRGGGPHVRGCWVVDLLLGKS